MPETTLYVLGVVVGVYLVFSGFYSARYADQSSKAGFSVKLSTIPAILILGGGGALLTTICIRALLNN